MFSGMSDMFKTDQLRGFLEKFKESMEEGDKNLGIPILEPFIRDHLNIDSKKKKLFSVEGYLENLCIHGLSNYTVKQADFLMAGFKAKVSLLFHKIHIDSVYDVAGTLLSENSFNGCGDLALLIKKLEVEADLQFEIKEGKLYLSDLELEIKVKKFDCDVSELYVDDDLPEDISETITDEAPNFLRENQNQISQYVSNILKNWINNILKKYTLVNLLDMIGQ